MQTQQTLELYYWPIRGLAERIRLILEYVGLKYNDNLITDRDEWFNKIKPSAALINPFINLPYLKDGQTIVSESEAILVYVILKAGREDLLGRTNEQKVDIAQVRGVFGDFHKNYINVVYGDYQNGRQNFLSTAKTYLGKLQTFLGNKNYICGEITFVDFILAEFFDILGMLDKTLLEGFPNLKALTERIWGEERIKQYVSSGRFKRTPLNGPSAKWNGQ